MIPTRTLTPDGLAVSAVGYGGMHLSITGRPDEAQAERVIHAALDAGVSLIDTADAYCLGDYDIGHNERLIAQAVSTWRGDRSAVLVATKGGLTRPGGRWETNGRPKHLRAACERSLKALNVEAIALYQLHAPDDGVPLEDSVGALERLREEGKILRVGLSNVSVDEIELATSITPVATVQNRLNPFFREALRDGVVDYCAGQRIGFLAYSPVGGGRLNLKLPAHPVVTAIARFVGASPHAVVIAWVMSKAPNVIPIPSARSEAHARDSVGAADLVLSADQVAEIDGAEFSRA